MLSTMYPPFLLTKQLLSCLLQLCADFYANDNYQACSLVIVPVVSPLVVQAHSPAPQRRGGASL